MNNYLNKNCPYLEMQCENLECDCPKYKAYIDVKDPVIFNRVMEENNFDVNQPAFDLVMVMQHSFASRIRQMDNLSKSEKDEWIDKYLVCIEDEVRELREHLSLYGEIEVKDKDIELKKEVIDILHFMMDLFIVGGANQDIIKEFYRDLCEIDLDSKEDLFEVAYRLQREDIDEYLNVKEDIKKDITILKASCRLLDACALVRQHISWKHWKEPSTYIDYNKLYHAYAVVFHEFMNLCILTMEEKEIKDIYVRKNVENILRQEYGY